MSVDLTNGPNANRLYVGYINYPHIMAESGLKVKSKLPNEQGFSQATMAYNGSGQLTNIAVDADKIASYYIIDSDDNATTFSDPLMVSGGITDFAQIGLSEFVGDYSSSVRTNCAIYNTWTDVRSGNKQYVSKLDICAAAGVYELTPIASTYYLDVVYNSENKQINLNVKSSINDILSIEVYSLDGKKLFNSVNQVQDGTTVLTVPMNAFANGKYICYSTNQQGDIVTRMFEKF
jgi:hypothetical protein